MGFKPQNDNLRILLVIIASGALTLFVKSVGFLKETSIAYHFGLSQELDDYIYVMLWSLFFVTPVAGSISTLLTPIVKQSLHQNPLNISLLISKLIRLIAIYCSTLNVLAIVASLAMYVSPYRNILPNFEVILYLVPLTAYFSGISIVCGGLLIAEEKHKTFNIIPITVPFSIIICLNTFPDLKPLERLVLGTCAGFLFEMALNLIAINKRITIWQRLDRLPSQTLNKIYSQLPSLIGASIILNMNLVIDQLMAKLVGAGAISAISFGNKITLGLVSILATLWIVLYPIFSDFITKKQFSKLRVKVFFWCGLTLAIGIPACALLANYSNDIIRLTFERGAFNSNSTQIVGEIQYFYLLHIPFYVVCVICSRVANASLKNRHVLYLNTAALMLNGTLNFLFIEHYGAVGIAMATLISYLMMSIAWLIYVTNQMRYLAGN